MNGLEWSRNWGKIPTERARIQNLQGESRMRYTSVRYHPTLRSTDRMVGKLYALHPGRCDITPPFRLTDRPLGKPDALCPGAGEVRTPHQLW